MVRNLRDHFIEKIKTSEQASKQMSAAERVSEASSTEQVNVLLLLLLGSYNFTFPSFLWECFVTIGPDEDLIGGLSI